MRRRAVLGGLCALPALCAGPGLARQDIGDAPLRSGTDAAPFAAALAHARGLDRLHALVIVHRGQTRLAEAVNGPAPDVPVNVKSVSKSVISALTGIAIARGELEGVGQPALPFLRRVAPRRADPRIHDITIGDLLTMRSGLTPVSGAAYPGWTASRYWIYEALSRPMLADPGSRMLYSTASTHILGAVLAEAAGQDLRTLAQERIGAPLDIEIPEWPKDPQGYYIGGNDMRLAPVAMARFGEMYRQGGLWQGRRVLPEAWVAQSWTPRTASVETGHPYGYGWYLWTPGAVRVNYARGHGGQMIFVVPDHQLTVAVTSDPARAARPGGYLSDLYLLMTAFVLPEAARI